MSAPADREGPARRGASARRWARRDFTRAAVRGAVGGLLARRVAEGEARLSQDTEPRAVPSLAEASDLVRAKKVSPVELVRGCLERIERLDPRLNSFITVTAESALAEARAAEADVRQGRAKGPLHGIPVALKDLVDTAGVRTTAGSNVFKDRVPTEDAEVVRRLKAAGAVLLGKLNLHEFAYGGSTVVSAFGPVRNPWSLEHVAGGSSAGSAAAVAAGLCYGAIGSDTGGSIRQPAAYCGIVGLKPTIGRVSTRGVVPLAWSLDHVGPMTRSVRDAALMLQAMAGADPGDVGCSSLPVPDYTAALGGKPPLRLGIPRAVFYEALDPEVRAAVEAALRVLGSLGASERDVALDPGNEASFAVLRAEAWAYHEPMVARRPELYQPETLRRIRGGEQVTTSAYIGARRALEALRRSTQAVFDTVDLLVTPTTPVPPPAIADLLANIDDLRAKEVLTLRNTRPFSALGLPTISVPCGFTSAGLPIGLQITGAAGHEAGVLALAHAYEQATDWHTRRPPLAS
jgi:aspartyl-tRNA(Asn)/glutamyl-tRNA(Gln) amidotransferase subunit A